jgi:hypothetical protein
MYSAATTTLKKVFGHNLKKIEEQCWLSAVFKSAAMLFLQPRARRALTFQGVCFSFVVVVVVVVVVNGSIHVVVSASELISDCKIVLESL